MTAMQHLYAHFCVSLSTFCSRAPPEPKTMLSKDQPEANIESRILQIIS